jgi:hypothetical protein
MSHAPPAIRRSVSSIETILVRTQFGPERYE